MEYADKIIEILRGVKDDIDYEMEDNLVDGGLLDSFDLVGVITELKEAFDIDITIDDISAENFNSVEAICALVGRIINED